MGCWVIGIDYLILHLLLIIYATFFHIHLSLHVADELREFGSKESPGMWKKRMSATHSRTFLGV
jgi:hypothetical protein